MKEKKPKLVFDFPNSPQKTFENIKNQRAPRERYFGYLTLAQRGWNLTCSDDRWSSNLERLRRQLRIPFELPNAKTLKKWREADYVIITARLSGTLAFFAKLLGKKVIFIDAICGNLPRNPIRKMSHKLALMLCNKCILISDSQAELWAKSFKIPSNKFATIRYGLDTNFYKPQRRNNNTIPHILVVGRDHSRDFQTVIEALDGLDVITTFVTLKHMLPPAGQENKNIRVLENIEYDELFRCYEEADIAIIPLKKGTTYMSGIRAAIEAGLTKTPIIASETLGMREYFNDDEIYYVEPENPNLLKSKVLATINNHDERMEMVEKTYNRIINNYSLEKMLETIEQQILKIQEKSPR